MAASIVTMYDSYTSDPMPAASPTLSPTLSAIVAGFLGSSSGIPASTFPTKSAPRSTALVNIPPPALMNNAIKLGPIPTPAIIKGSGNIKKRTVMTIKAIAGTAKPTVAPPLKAVAKAGPNPREVACAALTAALTVILNDNNPERPDIAAPTAKATPLEIPDVKLIIIVKAIAIGITILNSRFRKAIAPVLTADDIPIILSVPLCCFPIHTARAPAAAIDANDAPIGITSFNAINTIYYENIYMY